MESEITCICVPRPLALLFGFIMILIPFEVRVMFLCWELYADKSGPLRTIEAPDTRMGPCAQLSDIIFPGGLLGSSSWAGTSLGFVDSSLVYCKLVFQVYLGLLFPFAFSMWLKVSILFVYSSGLFLLSFLLSNLKKGKWLEGDTAIWYFNCFYVL